MSSPEISVLIVSINVRDDLCACLRSLRRAASEAEFEVIVVDNASTDGSTQVVEAEFPEVRLHKADRNLGFAAAMNVALQTARGEFVLGLNPDTLVSGGSIAKLIAFLKEHPKAAIVGAQLTWPDGRLQNSTFTDPTLPKELLNFFPEIKRILKPRDLLRALAPIPRNGNSPPARRVQCVSGGAFLARTRILRDVVGFDEAFFVYHEDIDLCRRLRAAGWQVWSLPSAQVVHLDARCSGYSQYRFSSMPLLAWRLAGMDHYWRKHRSRSAHRAWRRQALALLNVRILLIFAGVLLGFRGRERGLGRIEELRAVKRMLRPPKGESTAQVA